MKPHLDIRTVPADGALRVVAEGELDLFTAPLLDAAVQAAEATDTGMVIVDIEAVSFIDSSGLRMLLSACARSHRDGRELRLTRGSEQASRLFEVVGVGHRLPFIDEPGPELRGARVSGGSSGVRAGFTAGVTA